MASKESYGLVNGHEPQSEHPSLDLQEDGFLEDDEVQLRHAHRQQQPAAKGLWRFLYPLFFYLLGVLSTAALFTLRDHYNTAPAAQEACAGIENARLASQVLRTPVPEFPFEITTFEPNSTFQSRQDWDSGVAWNTILPPGRGFVFVDAPEQYDLLPGEQTDYGPIYSTSMFHQLHCLAQIRTSWEGLASMFEEDDVRHGLYLVGKTFPHVSHCLDYIRQGIMCAGDMTLEWPRQEGEGEGFAVDGWGVPHACRSWDSIMDYMDTSHFNMSLNGDAAGR